MKSNRYPYIQLWGKFLHSLDYFIEDQQELAAREHAPHNAIYRKDDGTWVTTDEVMNFDARKALGLPIAD